MAFNPDKCLRFRALEDNCKISIPSSPYGSTYHFSKNGATWRENEITLNNGECAYVRGTNYPAKEEGSTLIYNQFGSTGEFEIVSGNIMSLIDKGAGELTHISKRNGFHKLFSNSKLKSIPAGLLPATELTEDCYYGMFFNCESLTAIPANLLPATELAAHCYRLMFANCTSLTEIPAGLLPATELAESCYSQMFDECTSLTEIPADLLPATTLAKYCYYCMFAYCKLLTAIPAGLLPAIELAEGCYTQMFSSCRNLTTVPKGALAVKTFPDFQACYGMFMGCSALNEIHVYFTEWPTGGGDDALHEWVLDVSETGNFYCPTKLPDVRGVSRIPVGWTINREEGPFRNIKRLMIFGGDNYNGIN